MKMIQHLVDEWINDYPKYSLAIRPSCFVVDSVHTIKRQLRSAIGDHYGSANAEAHISLFEFTYESHDYQKVAAKLRRIASALHPFEIQYQNFDAFANNAFYVKLSNPSSQIIKDYAHQIALKVKPFKLTDKCKNPHLTIGRNLSTESLQIAFREFKAFEATELCDTLVIRKFNVQRKQYDIVEQLPLLGIIDRTGEQLHLL